MRIRCPGNGPVLHYEASREGQAWALQVYGSARQAGGTARIESKLAEGTTVSVFYPCIQLPIRAAMHDRSGSGMVANRGDLVLLVDDDEDLRSIVSKALEALGYEGHSRRDGRSGLEELRSVRPSVLVVDFMPGMNGAEMAAGSEATGRLSSLRGIR